MKNFLLHHQREAMGVFRALTPASMTGDDDNDDNDDDN